MFRTHLLRTFLLPVQSYLFTWAEYNPENQTLRNQRIIQLISGNIYHKIHFSTPMMTDFDAETLHITCHFTHRDLNML